MTTSNSPPRIEGGVDAAITRVGDELIVSLMRGTDAVSTYVVPKGNHENFFNTALDVGGRTVQ